jgi:hypothetical protein
VLLACEQTKPQPHGQGSPSVPSSGGGRLWVFTQLVVPSLPTTTQALPTGQLHVVPSPSMHGGSARLQLTTGMHTGTSSVALALGASSGSGEQCVRSRQAPFPLQQ